MNDVCNFCLEIHNENSYRPYVCNHIFHSQCFEKWRKSCPICKAKISKKICHIIEKELGRKTKNKNEPRTCDIDIIDYNGKVMNFTYKNLIFKVPHEKIIYRNFVLFPLQEIAPKWVHPMNKDSIDVLIKKLSNEEKKSILKITKA